MNCHTFELRIGDYVDGTLAGPEAAAVEAHLSACAPCRAVAADFAAIRSAARALEPHLPAPAVWHRIAAAAAAAPQWRTFLGVPIGTWRHAGATAMVALIAIGLSTIGTRLTREATVPAPMASAVPLAPVALMNLETEEHYASAIASLQAVATDGRDLLDAQTVVVLDAGMTVIDEAIDESRSALASQPQSELAQDSLLQAMRSKLTLLQSTLALINEMRKGSADGAARIIAESN